MNRLQALIKTRAWRKVEPHLAIFGACLACCFVARRVAAISRNLLRFPVDIANRYGKGSFAVITGGASGIGKHFAIDLAKKGFNIIIIDFNQKAMDEAHAELERLRPGIIVKLVRVDFAAGDTEEFYNRLGQELATFDISILINNVGASVGSFGHFHRIPQHLIIRGFNVNVIPSFMMTNLLINKMTLRGDHKSLILNLGSASAYIEMPFFF